MSAVGKTLAIALPTIAGMALGGPVGAVIGAAAGGAASEALFSDKSTTSLPSMPTRDDTQKIVEQNDALARRKGAAADILTGSTGAEAATGTTGRLVIGS
jgi:hypothetical protein